MTSSPNKTTTTCEPSVQLVSRRSGNNCPFDELHTFENTHSLNGIIDSNLLRDADECSEFVATHPLNPVPDAKGRNDADGWLELRVWAEMFNDSLDTRKRTANRMRSGSVDTTPYVAYFESIERSEAIVRKELARCYKRVVPSEIVAWQNSIHGLGVHTFARLLGHIGHPVWTTPHHWEGTGENRVLVADEPIARTISQLHQYCGHGAPGRARKGMTAEDALALGSPIAKTIVYIIAEGCMKKFDSPFRAVYDEAKAERADRLHSIECVPCGSKGKPAPVGSPWRPGHVHAHALRMTGRAILHDLWIVAGGSKVDPVTSDGPSHLQLVS